ncbi:MAG: NRDE family protein [Holophagaceae bacterium]|nr:NRDE family protein [Holophagaceae bacterium]
MCVVGFQWHPGSQEPLLLLGNRDEYYDRPTAPLAWWEGGRILAGRDLRGGGTWLGVTRTGRMAVLTNFRDPTLTRPEGPSRGQLPVAFLESDASAVAWLESLRPEAGSYSPFNLLLYDGEDLLGYESRHDRVVRFEPGIHAVSNGDFDEAWPKVLAVRAVLAAVAEDDEALLKALEDDRPCAEDDLPRTGVSLDLERLLSPMFIRSAAYGTRASTLVRLGRVHVRVLEQGFLSQGRGARAESQFERSRE